MPLTPFPWNASCPQKSSSQTSHLTMGKQGPRGLSGKRGRTRQIWRPGLCYFAQHGLSGINWLLRELSSAGGERDRAVPRIPRSLTPQLKGVRLTQTLFLLLITLAEEHLLAACWAYVYIQLGSWFIHTNWKAACQPKVRHAHVTCVSLTHLHARVSPQVHSKHGSPSVDEWMILYFSF